ncbi:MAG: phosphate propanoyltransferase [Bacillota bacterium]
MADNISPETLAAITAKVLQRLCAKPPLKIPVGVSNRHVHLSKEDVAALFGKGYELTPMKALKQPGQYACGEVLTIKGPKGSIENVRILGPERPVTQAEISVTDSFKLGVKPPVRISGDLKGSASFELIGPKGSVTKDAGCIIALRHIHMTPEIAKEYGYTDKQVVDVLVGSDARRTVFKNVPLRITDASAPELHLDTDEANASGAVNDSLATIIVPGA